MSIRLGRKKSFIEVTSLPTTHERFSSSYDFNLQFIELPHCCRTYERGRVFVYAQWLQRVALRSYLSFGCAYAPEKLLLLTS